MKSNEFFYGQLGHEGGPANPKQKPDGSVDYLFLILIIVIYLIILFTI